MSKHKRTLRMGLRMAAVALTAAVGCVDPGDDSLSLLVGRLLPSPADALTRHGIAGASDQRAIIVRTRLPQELLDFVFGSGGLLSIGFIPGTIIPDITPDPEFRPPPPTTQVVAVDLDTLETRLLVEIHEVGADAAEMRSDGRWLAWPDNPTQTIGVIDLDADTSPHALDSGLDVFHNRILALDAGRLLASGRNGDQRALVLFNLATGAETVLETYLDDPVALKGDTLAAIRAERDEQERPDSASSTTKHIELLDVVTGRILATIAEPSVERADRFFLTDERLLWTLDERRDSSTIVRTVFAYDMATSVSEQIAQFVSSDAKSIEVIHIGSAGILLESKSVPAAAANNLPALLGAPISRSYDLISFDGVTRTLVEESLGVLDLGLDMPPPLLLDGFVLIREAQGGQFVLLTIDSGAQRGFDPFAGLD